MEANAVGCRGRAVNGNIIADIPKVLKRASGPTEASWPGIFEQLVNLGVGCKFSAFGTLKRTIKHPTLIVRQTVWRFLGDLGKGFNSELLPRFRQLPHLRKQKLKLVFGGRH